MSATQYQDSSPSSLLYFILRKADLGIEITELEQNWLRINKLFETIEAIENDQQFKAKEIVDLGIKFSNLKSQYKTTNYHISWKSSPLYFILCRLDSENQITDLEIKWLKSYGLHDTVALAQQMEDFARLKAKYQATKHQNPSPVSRLYRILKELDLKERLRDSDVTWLNEHELFETLEFFQEQEAAREAEFAQLKHKYQATKHPDSSVSIPLYPILQKLDADKQLSASEIDWLQQHEVTETLDIIRELEQKRHFAELKAKYKIQSGGQLEESEIEWLKETRRETIIAIAQEKHFAILKFKYDVSNFKDKLPYSPLYAILQKLEKGERLN